MKMLQGIKIRNFQRLFLFRYKSTTSRKFQKQEPGRLTSEVERLQTELTEFPHTPFSRAKTGPFLQDPPHLENTWKGDIFLQNCLKRIFPSEVYNSVEPDLCQFGHRAATDVYDLARQCELNQPYLEQYNAWGRRIDNIVTCPAWNHMKKISAEEGMIAIGYERDHGEWSRLHQMTKLYLYSPSSGLYSCPLAMTDGAAKIIESMQLTDLQQEFTYLTSRDPDCFWTSGQWMTERKGGSDVADGTETIAIPQNDGSYRLYGYKWFSSATDSDMTLTLARIMDEDGNVIPGTRGLSMFFLKTRKEDGSLNNIEVVKLKNKLGTRQLPTGELLIDGAVAQRASSEGRGVASIASMLTITRIHNAMASISGMRRLISLARDYSTRRTCFGDLIHKYPLHIQTLARMEVETRGCMILFLEVARLLGLDDCNKASDQDQLILRVLTPILKLYTAKKCMQVISEGLECFGGQGYIEDTGLPLLLRDAQVTPIWEGTTNVLSLDVMRAVNRTNGEVLIALQNNLNKKLINAAGNPQLRATSEKLKAAVLNILTFLQKNPDKAQLAARDFAFSLAHVTIGSLLIDHANWSGATAVEVATALKWCERDLAPVVTSFHQETYSEETAKLESALVFDGYSPENLCRPIY